MAVPRNPLNPGTSKLAQRFYAFIRVEWPRGAFLALGIAGCMIDAHEGSVVQKEEKRFTIDGTPQLNLRTFDGSIDVRSGDQNEVRVEILRRGPDAKTAAELVVNITQDGNTIVVEAPNVHKGDGGVHLGFWNRGSVSLVVTTPKKVSLDARSGDGSIKTEGLTGSLVLNTGDGAITVRGIDGQIKAHTGDGSIRIDDAIGSVDADTGDGAIDLTGRLESVALKTGDGSIRVRIQSGSVPATDWSIATGDGSIDLSLPDTLNADIDAQTHDGRVRADGLSNVTTSDRHDRDRRSVRGRLGAGGRTVRVRSGDGSIIGR